jgi:hypothetical protein
VSVAAPRRGPPESVPIEHETSERGVRAFPTSARHGLGHRELDPGAWLITALERCHLAWEVVRISPGRHQAKRGPAAT